MQKYPDKKYIMKNVFDLEYRRYKNIVMPIKISKN